ncbi:MAG: large-conductance mechanosensitive channel protein MscL [Planctomycetes bacterium]|nr:large-conductance mechanosensitive channel protein MscL [Planctomycetota bacterium]
MGMISEFKAFAMRGNVVDMAVGVIIGGAFGKIVGSMVSDVMMPVIGLATGGISFSEQKLELKAATADAPAVTMGYGTLIDAIINFVIIAFCLFMVINAMNAAKKKETAAPAPAAPPAPPRQEVLLEEIRDLLRKR